MSSADPPAPAPETRRLSWRRLGWFFAFGLFAATLLVIVGWSIKSPDGAPSTALYISDVGASADENARFLKLRATENVDLYDYKVRCESCPLEESDTVLLYTLLEEGGVWTLCRNESVFESLYTGRCDVQSPLISNNGTQKYVLYERRDETIDGLVPRPRYVWDVADVVGGSGWNFTGRVASRTDTQPNPTFDQSEWDVA